MLGISGAPAAGKTALAAELAAALGDGAAHVPMDGFHLADVELERLGNRDRMLRRLREDTDDDVYAPGFERVIEQPIAGAIPVFRSARLIITEGNYLLLGTGGWERVRPLLDEVWYAEIIAATREHADLIIPAGVLRGIGHPEPGRWDSGRTRRPW